MKTLSIGITTFRNRLRDVSNQVHQIRTYNKKIPILLAITANYGEDIPEDYRISILQLCSKYENIYPLMFPGYTGLAKMWNNLIVHSTTTHIFLMNDDITFKNPMAINEISSHIHSKEIFEVNWGFGTFVISKNIAHEMGYFDERFLAYGEEDGDFMTRYRTMFNKEIEKIPVANVGNRIQNRRDDSYMTNIDCMIADGGHKAKVNRGVFECKSKEKWENLSQYPYEKFIQNNRDNIGNYKKIISRK